MGNLKKCPWCGKIPELREESYGKVCFIECINEDCVIQPETDAYRTKEEAIEAWNVRKTTD